jgi:hypothetical protein
MSSSDAASGRSIDQAASSATAELAAQLRAVVDRGDTIADTAMQELLAVATRLYAARVAEGERLRALRADSQVNTTDAMVVVTGILHSVNVQLFELGMWQAWSGANALYKGEQV